MSGIGEKLVLASSLKDIYDAIVRKIKGVEDTVPTGAGASAGYVWTATGGGAEWRAPAGNSGGAGGVSDEQVESAVNAALSSRERELKFEQDENGDIVLSGVVYGGLSDEEAAEKLEQGIQDYFDKHPVSVGLDEAQLADYLARNDYTTKAYVDSEVGKVDATTIVVNGIDLEIDDDGNVTIVSATDGNEVAY